MDLNLNNNIHYRPIGRIPDLKSLNDNKRVFGKDITNNVDKRIKKNVSIYEKLPVAVKVQNKVRSRSLHGQKDLNFTTPTRDAILDYKQDVIDFMIKLQKCEPLDSQKHITEKMRQILIDWLVDVHDSFELKEQTLFLALSYLADFSAAKEISKEEYQLAGIACLWIASKYEQIYPPRTKNYVEVTADTYTLKDLKSMQGKIIQALNFDLNRTTSLHIFQAMIDFNDGEKDEGSNISEKARSFCKYVLETSIFEGLGKKYTPLTMVMAAISLSQNVLKTKIQLRLQGGPKVSKNEISECFKDMCIYLQGNNKYDLTSVKRKYSKSRNFQVSKMKIVLSE